MVADRTLDALRRYVSVLAVGVLLLWLLPRLLRGAAAQARGRPVLGVGVGLLGFVGVIVALVLVMLVTVLVAVVLGLLGLGSLTGMTVYGGVLVAAIIVFAFVLAVAFAAQATVGLALGRLLVRSDGRSFLGGLGALALGVLVVVLVAAIPVAGACWRPCWCWWGWGRCCCWPAPAAAGSPSVPTPARSPSRWPEPPLMPTPGSRAR